MKWDIEHIRLCELAHAWKKRTEAAERKVDELIQQDGLAREIERLREELLSRR